MARLDVDTLFGGHVVLEPLRPTHVDPIAAAASGDRSSFRWTKVPDGVEESRRYVEGLLTDAASLRVVPFVQRRVSDGLVVGCTRFLHPLWTLDRNHPDEIEIGGTWLAATAQRTRINTEAKLLLLAHAFDAWGVQRVAICTDSRNERSRAAIERLGASLNGILPRHRRRQVDGEPDGLRDTAVYSILDDAWPTIRSRLEDAVAGTAPSTTQRSGKRRASDEDEAARTTQS